MMVEELCSAGHASEHQTTVKIVKGYHPQLQPHWGLEQLVWRQLPENAEAEEQLNHPEVVVDENSRSFSSALEYPRTSYPCLSGSA
jgi:hypothetical protein